MPTLAVLGAVIVLGLGCSASEDTAATTTSSDTSASEGTTSAGGVTDPLGECPHKLPGEVLTADEAVVRFSPARVCPGYVTVGLGTPVGFVNIGGAAATVAIWEGIATDAAEPPLTDERLEAGGRWEWSPTEIGVYTYRTDALESFTGTIEVLE